MLVGFVVLYRFQDFFIRKEIVVHFLSPTSDLDGFVSLQEQVALNDVSAIFEPYVRMQGIVDDDVVFNGSVKSFSQFDTPMQTKIVVDMVIGTSIVQIDVPAVIASEAIVPDDCGVAGVQQDQFWVFGRAFAHFSVGWVPESVASPGVERAVVAGFQYIVESIVVFNQMSAKSTVADIDSSSGS